MKRVLKCYFLLYLENKKTILNSFDTAGLTLRPTGPVTYFIISKKYTNANNATNGKIYT